MIIAMLLIMYLISVTIWVIFRYCFTPEITMVKNEVETNITVPVVGPGSHAV